MTKRRLQQRVTQELVIKVSKDYLKRNVHVVYVVNI